MTPLSAFSAFVAPAGPLLASTPHTHIGIAFAYCGMVKWRAKAHIGSCIVGTGANSCERQTNERERRNRSESISSKQLQQPVSGNSKCTEDHTELR